MGIRVTTWSLLLGSLAQEWISEDVKAQFAEFCRLVDLAKGRQEHEEAKTESEKRRQAPELRGWSLKTSKLIGMLVGNQSQAVFV